MFRLTVQQAVPIVRDAINWEKKSGIPAKKVRRGLSLPEDWSYGYDLIYNTELPWTLSHVLQSAFMGCVELGETEPWTLR